MRLPRMSRYWPPFGWDVLLPYGFLALLLLGVGSRVKIDPLMVASGFAMIYTLGLLLVKWLVEVAGTKLRDEERIPLSAMSGVALIVLVGSVSFALWPARALFLTQILLGVIGTLLCATILVRRARARAPLRRAQVAGASVPGNPYTAIAALWLLLLVGLVVFLGSSREGAERYTELFLADHRIRPCSNAPRSEGVQCVDIKVGVVNEENRPSEYLLAFHTPLGTRTLDPFTLADGETVEVSFEFRAGLCGQQQKIDVALYRGGNPSPYRSIRLSCALLSPQGAIGD